MPASAMHRQPLAHSPARRLWALLAAAGLATPALAQTWHWTGAVSDNWSNPDNWFPSSLPSETSHAKLGSLQSVENTDVSLDMSASIAALDIVDGMGLWTDNRTLHVSGDTLISGSNYTGFGERISTLSVGAVDGISFRTHDLTVTDEARYWLYNAYTRVYGTFSVHADTEFRGDGHVGVWGATAALVNDGMIFPGSGMGIHLTPYNGAALDLDGAYGDGLLFLVSHDHDTGEASMLRVDGERLADTFSGRIVLTSNADLFMNLTDGWTADAGSEICVGGAIDTPLTPAVIRGGDFTLAGTLSVFHSNTEGYVKVESSRFTLSPGALVTLDPNTRADFGAPATDLVIKGGTALVEDGAVLSLTAPTSWEGELAATGLLRQIADATVTGPSVLEVDVLDLDGAGAATWNINNNLFVSAAELDTNHSNRFDGTMNITAGFLAKLTLQLSGPVPSWTMNGTMNLAGDPNIFLTRLAGSPVAITGQLSVTSGKVTIAFDLTFADGAVATIATPSTSLQLTGATAIEADAEFLGQGSILNGPSGRLALSDGASLGALGLENRGVLRIGAGAPAAAEVATFANTATGKIRLDIGGYSPGDRHDALTVQGQALLGGDLQIDLIDAGEGAFQPQVGDSFTIITAGEIGGTFIDDPVTIADGSIYEWRAIYGLKRVGVELIRISECVGDFNGDGVIDTIDMIKFFNAWAGNEMSADMNRDGEIDTADVIAFLTLWADGC